MTVPRKYIYTTNSGRYTPFFLAPAESWGALWAPWYGAFGPIVWGLRPHTMGPQRGVSQTILWVNFVYMYLCVFTHFIKFYLAPDPRTPSGSSSQDHIWLLLPGPYPAHATGPYPAPAPGPYMAPFPGPYPAPAPGSYPAPALRTITGSQDHIQLLTPGPYPTPAPRTISSS